ncbi:helix-turn-helix domain-containing protein [Euzebya tangerina]|uniref:helix-turn-helix domain-containing protein n=1 Tax=Euzebya tangerina TaxID=591198 RepID=UPI000E31B950|nr:helix-turn-helix transcriptional regulator [Euzebya tangerina]
MRADLDALVRLRRARDRMDRHYAGPLNVPELAQLACMSPGHFSRQFKLAYGETPYAYLMTRRIERAMALLRDTERTVTEICFAVGFGSLGTFSTRFAELVGTTPTAFRERARAEASRMPPCVERRVSRPVRNEEASRPRLYVP